MVFVATTAYQLLACIQIKTKCFPNASADILLLSLNRRIDNYGYNLIQSGMFERVLIADEPFSIFCQQNEYTRKIHALTFFEKYPIVEILRSKKYKKIFLSYGDIINAMLYKAVAHQNFGIKICYYDEGIANYCIDITKKRYGRSELIGKLLGYTNPCRKSIEEYWLFKPEYIVFPHNFVPYKIPSITLEDLSIKIFQDARKKETILSKIVFLDTPHREEEHIVLDYTYLENILDKKEYWGMVTIKKHPAQTKLNFRLENSSELSTEVPWEIIIAKDRSLEEKILISIFSTAVITPKMLYEKEPTVIILYEIFKDKFPVDEKYKKLFRKVQESYKTNKFFIPTSWDEVEKIIFDTCYPCSQDGCVI